MNGKTAKRLRRIARELHLNPETAYAPVGPLRRRADRTVVVEGIVKTIPGQPLPRPFALGECERKAQQEAKKIYKGQVGTDDTMPGQVFLRERVPFHIRHVHSMKSQPEGPVLGGSGER